jgi:hypothetical protein
MCHADVILESKDFVVMAVLLSPAFKSEKCEERIKNV